MKSLAAAASSAYDDLVRVARPLLGQAGVDALLGRSVHLVQREFPAIALAGTEGRRGSFAEVIAGLGKQDPAGATDAAAALFATFAGLLVTFIGGPLTRQLLAKAWPDAYSTDSKER